MLPYDILVLATGSRPVLPPVDGLLDENGSLLPGAVAFRTLTDCMAIAELAANAEHAVVLGAGVLGLETARGLAGRGLPATLVQRGPRLMERQLDLGASRVAGCERSPPISRRDFGSAKRKMIMTDVSLDDLGPVDYLVVEVPAGATNFTGEMAAELRALVDSGIIRVIDVLIVTKDEDDTVEATELSDIDERGDLQAIEAELAAPFASAARRSGGQLIADGRIPIQAIIASIEADEATAEADEAITTAGD